MGNTRLLANLLSFKCIYPTSVSPLIVVKFASTDQRAMCSMSARLPLLGTLNQRHGLRGSG